MSKRNKSETVAEQIARKADQIRASIPPGQSKAFGDRISGAAIASQAHFLLSAEREKARRDAERDETQRAILRALQTLEVQSAGANGQRKPRGADEPTRPVGAPDKCSPFVEEFRRRVKDGEVVEESCKQQAERLRAWGLSRFRPADVPAAATIRKQIGRDYRLASQRGSDR